MVAMLTSSRLISTPFSAKITAQRRSTRTLIRQPVVKTRATSDDDVGAAGTAAIAAGLVANPIVYWSLYTLKTTGAGLQGDILGGLEGVSYLAVLGIFGWSLKTKISTGSGLPAGPSGLLGAVEGLSFLSVAAAAVVFGLKAVS